MVETDFAAAHFVLSESIHGHNFKVRVWLKSDVLNSDGMVADFRSIKKILDEVVKTLDHSNLNDNSSFSYISTTECIAKYIFEEFKSEFIRNSNLKGDLVCAVDVCENDRFMARYES
jgi:6-pyruvoyltetrahydropterin/6-carboxytetrahydropterin synthase